MNSPGDTMLPSLRCQRAKASAPTVSPVRQSTFGW